MDATISKLIVRELVQGGRQSIPIQEINEQTSRLANLLRNEYLLRDKRGFPESVYHRLE